MGDISDGMCVRCHRDLEDEDDGGICNVCRAIPAVSIAKVKLALLKNGLDVADPSFEGAQYDFLVRDGGAWHGVQVKTAYGGMVNTCRTGRKVNRPYSEDLVDMIAVVDGDDVFCLPLSECNNGGRMKMEDIRATYKPYGANR